MARLPSLRALNRYTIMPRFVPSTTDRKQHYVWELRPRGFQTILATFEAPPGTSHTDIWRFFEAIQTLANMPAPPVRRR
jgi:hypothetical protein